MHRNQDNATMPRVEVVSEREAVPADRASTFAVVCTATPPAGTGEHRRPPLNLALVIDRSGSMAGRKLSFARKAARYLVRQLLPTDSRRFRLTCKAAESARLARRAPTRPGIPRKAAAGEMKRPEEWACNFHSHYRLTIREC